MCVFLFIFVSINKIIVTGKYAETHGVTGNTLYDSTLGYLTYGYDLFHYDANITPIWTLNELNDKHSGCLMWPGSEFEYRGRKCSHTKRLDKNMQLTQRVDLAIEWIKDSQKPANLVMLYSDEPDDTCHAYGCESPQVRMRERHQPVRRLLETGDF